MGRWQTARYEALERDNYQCRRCLRPCHEVHHGVVKGIGGTSDPDIAFGAANLACLCPGCHTFIHANPEYGYESGFLVHSWEDPAEIPIGRHPDDWTS